MSAVRCESMIYTNMFDELNRSLRFHVLAKLQGFFKIARQECDANGQPQLILLSTQRLLSRIPSWTNAQVADMHRAISNVCDDVGIKISSCVLSRIAVFEKCYNVNVRSDKDPVDVAVFVHRLFIEAGRIFYMCPQNLCKDSNPTIHQQQLK